jgi:Family of unknown function (DUF6464)
MLGLTPLPTEIPVEIIVSASELPLGQLYLDEQPQPGTCLMVAGQSYLVLERKHRYQLRSGRYQLHKITLYVQPIDAAQESGQADRWVGDRTCLYNARSELLRCAVNPAGPCDRCTYYQPAHPIS